MRGGIWSACALVGTVCLAGCSSQDAQNLGADTKRLGQDIAPIAGNAALKTKIVTHLSLHKGIDISGLQVDTNDKVVTLNGHVRDEGMHKKVLSTVKETTGVESVVDHLRIEK